VRYLYVRAIQIDTADSGNAYHHCSHDLRASGRAAGEGMKLKFQVHDDGIV
jgi:hypothetical protein